MSDASRPPEGPARDASSSSPTDPPDPEGQEGGADEIARREGRSPSHQWEDASEFREEFDHPLWKEMEERSQGAGHGGMDFLEDDRLIKCLRDGTPTDMNVYDAAALSSVTPLSEWSVANGSQAVNFPDFTRGKWRVYPQLPLVTA